MKLTPHIAGLVLAAALAGCATTTAYQAKTPTSAQGFTETKLEDNRFRVSFAGNTVTSRETVETFLLYRAAELTLAQGFDTFLVVDRHTDTKSRTLDMDPWHGPFGGWHPDWNIYDGYGFGWGPYWSDPHLRFGHSRETVTVEKFQAQAEILMVKGPKDAADPKAFDAHSVLANLGPKVVRPKPPLR
ncbi:MAG: hypothetical protein CGW95_15735 [Phenylobacterium zucineum]|nr:MAG: hypothetical protein CGW95_15735 [Phenylobacterium zucineum]